MSATGVDDRFPRESGILLHITSLPGPHGIGDLGPDAFRFVDFLASAQQRLWQILPLVPTGFGNSPYAALSAFAGNPLLISLPGLAEEGLLDQNDLANAPSFPPAQVDYTAVRSFKFSLLQRAFQRFSGGQGQQFRGDFESFCQRSAHWLDDYALYMALREAHKDVPWWRWEADLVARQRPALERARNALAGDVRFRQFLQFVFFSQWFGLKNYANNHAVRIVGDIPIFVAHDSADVWAHQDIFTLDERGNTTVVAGVPPDYFSATGQRWGNPHYRWDVLARSGYRWWVDRLRESFRQVDVVRIDHFRGFEAYWEIPADQPTAVHGRWVKGPGEAFFRNVENSLGQKLPIIVEDLGSITPEVEALRRQLGYPGMKVLQFAFGSDASNYYLPHNFGHDYVVYTGTHDNDTTAGWFAGLGQAERSAVQRYLGRDGSDIAWDLIRLALSSVAKTAIVPLQDVLALGSWARMNFPGKAEGNWSWRYAADQLTRSHADRLRELTTIYGRAIG
ncbi:MAG: 4-alpha-glucanotransferase [Chloroflexi bacterium]|nr:4-alpha-glucanotransferase [Chloroflexota bacterium]